MLPLLCISLIGLQGSQADSERFTHSPAFRAAMPFMGGTVTQMMEEREKKSGRSGFVARIDAIKGVGPVHFLSPEGKFEGVSNPYWEIYADPEKKKVRLTPKSTAMFPRGQIDIFCPKILNFAAYAGITEFRKPENATVKLSAGEDSNVISVQGVFRLKELENFPLGKKIVVSPILEDHQFSASVSNVEKQQFLDAVVKAGSYKVIETESEKIVTIDGSKAKNLWMNSRLCYGYDDPKNSWGIRLRIRSQIMAIMAPQDMERISEEMTFIEEPIAQGHPMYKDALDLIEANKRDAPVLREMLKTVLSMKLSIGPLGVFTLQLETSPGKWHQL